VTEVYVPPLTAGLQIPPTAVRPWPMSWPPGTCDSSPPDTGRRLG